MRRRRIGLHNIIIIIVCVYYYYNNNAVITIERIVACVRVE